MEALSTFNLTKKFGQKTVVDGLTLSIKKGIIFGFLGRNGAGKSTFINMVTGLSAPTSGGFEILDHPRSDIKDIRHKIGVMPDYSTFYEDLTAFEHLKYFSKILKLSLSKNDLMNLIERVGLEDAAHLKTKNFSFGMKKKLGIAQSLINNPDIVFLDEPTSGVDANSVLNIHTLIKDVASNGTTIFLTSHNLDEVEKLCDEVAIMNKGKIQTRGNMEQLRAQYQNNIAINIKHSPILGNEQNLIKENIKDLVVNSIIESTHSKLFVENENAVSEINKIFVGNNIDVFRIEVDEPSLEEIFINSGETKDYALL